MSNRVAAPQFIVLAKKAAVDLGALYFQHQVVGNIGSELDVGFACAEYFIQAVVWLYRAHVTMIAEVGGQPLTDQHAPLLDKAAEPGHGFLLQHDRIGKVDELIFADIVERYEVRLDVRIEKSLVGPTHGLGVEVSVALLHIVEELRLGDKDQSDVAFDGV